jgi:hypothetical protein
VGEGRPLLILADRVHTCGPGGPARPDAVLVQGSRIVAVGSRAELGARAPRARVLDLAGAVLTPGLTDAHVHLTEWALARAQVALDGTDSPEAAARLVASAPAEPSGWVRGRGWNPHRWQGARPHRALLDAWAPDRPVALQSHDMHALWVNGAALAAAGIGAGTPDPDGGRIERDETGAPTGLLLERAAELVVAALPVPSLAEVVQVVDEAQAELHALGITGVHSFPGIALPDPDPLPVLQELHARGRLRLRILQHIRLDRLDAAIALGLRSGFGGDALRIGGVKLFLDGALGSRTAWMRAPYRDATSRGVSVLPPDAFRAIVARAAAAGIAATVHAIGDAAVALALEVLADPALRVPALPHRIEHVQCCPPELFDAAGRAGIVCSVQPCHLITDWRVADRHWGPERARGTYAFAALAAGGAVLAFGSDAPVEPIDPRRSWYAAVTRQDLAGEPGGGWYPEHSLDAAAALRAFTVGPALAAGLSAEQGALVPGAPADLAAWDRDPLTCDPRELLHMQCVATFAGGEQVHG